MLNTIDGFIIDLDGTVYKGATAIAGAGETIDYLRSIGKRIVFLSNRGNISRAMCRDKLAAMHIHVPEDEIILSSTVTARYLMQRHPGCKAWALGDPGLRDELAAAGVQLAEKPEEADWVVITLHETLTYRELNQAFKAVRNGARIIATNDDKTFPGDEGDSIDVAGMIGAIVASTGQEVEVVIGKPSAHMSEAALSVLGLPPERCMIIGDSLMSDIRLGKRSGIRTALVLSGSVTRDELDAVMDKPDCVWESIGDLKMLLSRNEEIA
ncbi:HAD-IIA family hydrolase [Paenibacillus mendelii]|uniref:Acid sugar phosphatase n=1 Tax=Paenibacillus mendelii TaxID=206163 RepID=A0ABV6JFC5_9BACL|nr:HAD-IIA family hydrolase [Paenibacillus mendelii]MCQ6558640.1 HAD-IIA family hydrolase [Paenibacillus mendelii]